MIYRDVNSILIKSLISNLSRFWYLILTDNLAANTRNNEFKAFLKSVLKLKIVLISQDFLAEVSKGGFFSESAIRFFRSPNLQKKKIQKTILGLKFKFPTNNTLLLLAGNLNFKFRIVFGIFFLKLWRSKKTNRTFWKKATFSME